MPTAAQTRCLSWAGARFGSCCQSGSGPAGSIGTPPWRVEEGRPAFSPHHDKLGGEDGTDVGLLASHSTGASRGIGAEIAKALVARGANVAVAAKSAEPHKTLPGTIHTVVDELHEIAERNNTGAKALALQLDVRDAGAVEDAVHRVASHFRSLDMVVNNVRRCF